MVSERVREAMKLDLRESLQQAEALGLWVTVGGGRLAGDDIHVVRPGREAMELDLRESLQQLRESLQQAEALGLWVTVGGGRLAGDDLHVVRPGDDAAPACGARRGVKPKGRPKARPYTPGGNGAAKASACAVCDAKLRTGRGTGNRKHPLCKIHAGRWHVHHKRPDALSFDAWVEHQKAGGGRRKKKD